MKKNLEFDDRIKIKEKEQNGSKYKEDNCD